MTALGVTTINWIRMGSVRPHTIVTVRRVPSPLRKSRWVPVVSKVMRSGRAGSAPYI